MEQFGKPLMLMGAVLFFFGLLLMFSEKLPSVGRLPGDIYIEKENFKFYFPITTGILFSILLSAVLWLIRKISG